MDFFSHSPQGSAAATPPKKARIEIIPLIDVIFFLLATFVLFTLSLNKIQSIPVDLPQASATPATATDDDAVVIQVSDAKTAFWNRELFNLDELPSRLVAYKATTARPKILVSGDERASFGDTVAVLDAVKSAGITLVSIETAPRASGR